ncbi:UbiA family prenyltransferase [Faecalibacter sp. LW9]|uniref:UbiA family prenyltransferase n=1 Tax=Faecalibacter sp. LW9 TaxID=3103144 RepID=UPI002AFF1116|nr:UbiA family prenyltransferase [Faecalibacter sp. LW9]
MKLPLNAWDFYAFIFSISILFYLFAYNVPINLAQSSNIRTQYYINQRIPIIWFNIILYLVAICSSLSILIKSWSHLWNLDVIHYLILGVTLVLSTSYYNWKFGLSLRKYTWFKPTLIAWTWAIISVYFPVLMLQLEDGKPFEVDARFYFLFSQTFMYFIVNAIMFDMKDFEDDSNRNIKTFVVRYGYKKTLYRIIYPLIILGFISFITFGIWYDLPWHRTILMLFPILLLFYFAVRLNRPKSILYYLIAIDGLIVIKAIFGILSVLLFE